MLAVLGKQLDEKSFKAVASGKTAANFNSFTSEWYDSKSFGSESFKLELFARQDKRLVRFPPLDGEV
jgi:hypothetical protein